MRSLKFYPSLSFWKMQNFRVGTFVPLSMALLFCLSFGEHSAVAAGKKPKTPIAVTTDGKRTVAIENVRNMQIELPDHTVKDFGQGFQAGLTRQLLNSGNFGVMDSPSDLQTRAAMMEVQDESTPGYSWPGSVVAVATLKTHVNALSFKTGFRGERMFYGFDERNRTPFNDGSGELPNEFPLLARVGEPSWFGQSFVQKGTAPFDSRSGLDLGDGFSVNVLFAWLTAKYASYRADLHLQLEYELPMGGTKFQEINVTGKGFFFDVAGAYQNYSLGIMVARRDAMEQAVEKALNASYASIQKALEGLPLMARVDAVLQDKGIIFLGTGIYSSVKTGVLFQAVDHPALVIEVKESVLSGSLGEVKMGSVADVKPGMILHQIFELPTPGAVAMRSAESQSVLQDNIQLGDINLKAANLGALIPLLSQAQAVAKYILEGVFLPYRIYRYFSYDQKYHARNQLGGLASPRARETSLAWFMRVPAQAWAKQIGLTSAPLMPPAAPPVVAVIDSGVDYNHPVLHSNLWMNPLPMLDPSGAQDTFGWDFISGDARPYDDGYHGTEMASAVVAVAPEARIMPLKVFNAWGLTTSAALYSAFVYAVDHGAKVILCGWSTGLQSKALEMGIEYARQKNVVVVVATGDQGVRMGLFPVYPAYYAHHYDNVLPVTAVDSADRRLGNANYDPALRAIAAPGQNIRVADPRLQAVNVTSTGVAAALVAGAMARIQATDVTGQLSGRQAIDTLLSDADAIGSLQGSVQGGLRLRIR